MRIEEFNEVKKTIPLLAGVYQFYNKDNTIIYIGKAISLRNRVSSYFQSTHLLSRKTQELVSHIHHLDWIACPNEHDALLLENNLIKKWKPKYNINLKDDKTYPYIAIRNEPFPRVYLTRKKSMVDKKSECYGPYTSVKSINEVMQHIREQIPLRTCSLNLSQASIDKGKYRPCLEYHIKKCDAPCAKMQTKESYENSLQQVRMLLKGNFQSLIQSYKQIMNEKASLMQFEEAQVYKDKIEAILQLKHKSFFDFKAEVDLDIFCFKEYEAMLWVNFSVLRQGCILQSDTTFYTLENQDANDDLMSTIIFDLREKFGSTCEEMICNHQVQLMQGDVTLKVPKLGQKKEMIDWAMSNIDQRIENHKQQQNKESQKFDLLEKMKHQLHLATLPLVIESFDNSHLQGSAQVSAMVVFKNGLPSKKDYRTFHIKSTTQIDDYASMREVIYRRYLRRINEGKPMPDLIIIDGGKGQLNEAVGALESLGLREKVSILSIAKKQEHLFFPDDKDPIVLDMRDPVLQLIQQIRDETHRFVIGFHRKSQIKKTMETAKNKK